MSSSLAEVVADIQTLVGVESPSEDLPALERCAEVLARLGSARLHHEPERVVVEGRTHLRWRFGDGPVRVLILGHYDTVWPLGSLASQRAAVEHGILRGPGCFDMKAGIVIALHAVAALAAPAGVTVLITADEETGSATSRALIEAEAAGAVAALVLEPSADGGALKIERKGVSFYELRVEGRAAHAGLEPERGVNATVEVAHQILRLEGLADATIGTTVTATVLHSGTTGNTVPASAQLHVDVRATSLAEQVRVDEALRAARPVLAGARIDVGGGPNRPPLPLASSAALFAQAGQLHAELGLGALAGACVGGGSDGNFTAGVGVPTLDGLGAVGGGAHASDEHVLVAALPGRIALLTALVRQLLQSGAEQP